MNETPKYKHLTLPYCSGNGIDIGSGSDPVKTETIQVELPDSEFSRYHGGAQRPPTPGAWFGDARDLPFKGGVLDYVYSSHLLEDFVDWQPMLSEWLRVLKPGGHLVILVPEEDLWNTAVSRGQPPNCNHHHCGRVGELSKEVSKLAPVKIIEDRLTACHPGDYSILFIAQKL